MDRFRRLALATAAATVVLFTAGGLVRGTGSGLGCSTWPACEPGTLFPTGTVHGAIEFGHRVLAFLVLLLTAASAVVAWVDRRSDRAVLALALASFPLVLIQAALGGVVVLTDLDPWWVTAHFVAALVLIADVTAMAVLAFEPSRSGGVGLRRAATLSLIATGALLLVGTYIRAKGPGYGIAFPDWPLMNGRLVPTLGGVTTPMFLHRVLALVAFLLVLWTQIRARAARPRSPVLVTLSTWAVALFLIQIMVGAANVWTKLRPWAVVLHVAFAVLVWTVLVALVAASAGRRPSAGEAGEHLARRNGHRRSLRRIAAAYLALTKPRIIVLLLVTTVPAMLLARRGLPSPWLALATLLGGAVAAGAANAINCYLDRDIDGVMRRTRSRPLPAHEIEPERALGFGYVLAAASSVFLATTVNVLAATLALSAIAFYVFVYTMWLKRTTEQNIVIGGAAGAVPALVGWAAVTGSVGLPAWVLFAIVFVWTPPHFWALAMRYARDYAAAGVPMLPVVRGEAETRRQILRYSLALFATTLLLVPIAGMGAVYTATAVVLGGAFVWRALRLWRSGEPAESLRLYRYSILYLGLLFAAVGVDALVPLARPLG
ncbi:Protoheme IX farnesyltransferase [bacterium HR12]|nr:Protoheme IX farnesyltransferase [bacterium HR12]